MSILASQSNAQTFALDALVPGWREMVGALVWAWYDQQDPDTALFVLRKWMIRYTVTVKDLAPVLTLLFGPRP